MLVSDIPRVSNSESEGIFDVQLSQVHLDDEGVHINDDVYPLDESTIRSFGSLLDISQVYLKKCPQDLINSNVNYWLRHHQQADAKVHVLNGQPRFMAANTKIIPLKGVVDIIQRIFPENDEVAEFQVTDKLVHIDVISSEHRVEVPEGDGSHRPANDVTHGGLRIRIPADYRIRRPPEVYTYLNRLVCTNGMCVADAQHKLTLQGRDVPTILQDMESSARTLWEGLPEVLQTYRQTADMPIPGEITHFVHQLGQEHGIGARVLSRALDRVGELPAQASVYDVIQLFTNIANDENTTYRTRDSLQMLGGDLAARPEANTHRCNSCERLL